MGPIFQARCTRSEDEKKEVLIGQVEIDSWCSPVRMPAGKVYVEKRIHVPTISYTLLEVVGKGTFCRRRIGFSSIFDCTGIINLTFYP